MMGERGVCARARPLTPVTYFQILKLYNGKKISLERRIAEAEERLKKEQAEAAAAPTSSAQEARKSVSVDDDAWEADNGASPRHVTLHLCAAPEHLLSWLPVLI